MEFLQSVYDYIKEYLSTGAAIVIIIILLSIIRLYINRKYSNVPGRRLKRQVLTFVISFIGLLLIIIVYPTSEMRQGQLLSLLGILLTAAIALSSTTLLGNVMSGFMIRAIRDFKLGDFIKIGDHFGRVTERGLFHIEVQSEDRNLTTLPNLFVATHPIKVIRSSGTYISVDLSLGYDLPHQKVKKLLLKAIEAAKLEDPVVHILELGDYAITYRAAGILTKVRRLITARSKLRETVLDTLHGNGLEIASPTLMNTRAYESNEQYVPVAEAIDKEIVSENEAVVEAIAFDKANEAESLENIRESYDKVCKQLEEMEKETKDSPETEAEITRLGKRKERLKEYLNKKAED